MSLSRLMKVGEVAERLGVKPGKVYREIALGRLGAYKPQRYMVGVSNRQLAAYRRSRSGRVKPG
jgi:excisionase family DNA binding protein